MKSFFYKTCLKIKYLCRSAGNKGRSTVNYCQSPAFDRHYLSCNDHCDRLLFQEIFFLIFFINIIFIS